MKILVLTIQALLLLMECNLANLPDPLMTPTPTTPQSCKFRSFNDPPNGFENAKKRPLILIVLAFLQKSRTQLLSNL